MKHYSKLGLIALLLVSMVRVHTTEVAPNLPGSSRLVEYDSAKHVYIDRNTWFDNWTLGFPTDSSTVKSEQGKAEYPPVKKTVISFQSQLFRHEQEKIYAGMMLVTQGQRQKSRLVLINVEQMLNEQVGDKRQYRVWPHLGLIFVGTVADEEGYEVIMWDEYAAGPAPLEKLIQPGDIVGLSLVVTGIDRGIGIAFQAKQLRARYVIAGNDSAAFRANQVMSLPDHPIDAVFTGNSMTAVRRFFQEIGKSSIEQLYIPGVQTTAGCVVRSNEKEVLHAERLARKNQKPEVDEAFIVPKLELYPHWNELWANYRATFGHKHSNPDTVKNATTLFAQGCTRTRDDEACRYCGISDVANISLPSREMMARSIEAYNAFGIDMIYNATDSVYEMSKVVNMLQEIGASWKAMTIYARAQGIARNPHLLDEWQKVATERLLVNVGMDSGSDKMLMRGIVKSSAEKQGSRLEENFEAVRRIKQSGAHLHYSLIFGSPGESIETCDSSIRFLERTIGELGDQLDICETDIFWLTFGSPASRVFHDYGYAQHLAGLAGKSISTDEWKRDFVQHAETLAVPICVEEAWYRHFTGIDLATAQAYNKRAEEIMARHTGSIRGRAFRPT